MTSITFHIKQGLGSKTDKLKASLQKRPGCCPCLLEFFSTSLFDKHQIFPTKQLFSILKDVHSEMALLRVLVFVLMGAHFASYPTVLCSQAIPGILRGLYGMLRMESEILAVYYHSECTCFSCFENK